ncbi:MAG: glycine cleavage system aminomethyltransferase GcvT [Alphaproteobacteria bacterium]
MSAADDANTTLAQTPLHALHCSLGAKMVPFAGYDMPVQYKAGIMAEHTCVRNSAGLFDVSHMGQARLSADGDAARALEGLVPGDIVGLAPGEMRYTLLLAEDGGILDDLIVTRLPDEPEVLFLVVNAACKGADFAHIEAKLAGKARLDVMPDKALLALQGPQAARVLSGLATGAANLSFMNGAAMAVDGVSCFVTRSGYTGEDGFEISVPNDAAEGLAARLLADDAVAPIGLGARDSLRLEVGLCLYGHDIDRSTTPVEGSLRWTIPKRRREAADFPGAATILQQMADGPTRRRVGIRPDGRAPAREGTEITDAGGAVIGKITSGGYGPTIGGPIAMGYVQRDFTAVDTPLNLMVRGKALPGRVAKMPFVPQNYYRG